MSNLQDQLAHLRRRIAAVTVEPIDSTPVAEAAGDVTDWLEGAEVRTAHGAHFESKRIWGNHQRHGSVYVSDLQELPGDLLTAISEGKLSQFDPRRVAYLDTETTGLAGGSGTYAFLIGVGAMTEAGFELRHFFMRDYSEESSQLAALFEHLQQFDVLVTYNGRTYDQPLLETRYRMSRMTPPFARMEHFDLLYGARRLYKLAFDSCRLVELESQILGVERIDDVPGSMIPYLYFEFLRTRSAHRMRGIFEHNSFDILTLACLTGIIPRAFHAPLDVPLHRGPEMVGLARWLRAAGRGEEAVVLLRRALDKTYYLHSGIAHLLAGLLGIWAILSTAWASDKYAAFINGSTLIAAAAMFWSTAQLVRSWSRLRLVSGACLGVLLICTAQGLIYRYIDLPDNLQHWKEIRLDEFRQRGWEETSFTAQQFERKFINGEIIGFYASSNTMAAMLVFMGIVAAGVAIQRLSNRDEPGWAGAITAAIIPALFVVFLTQSKTAYLTPVIAGIMLFAIPRVRKFMLARRTVVFSCAVALIALAVAVVIGHGVYHHSLPGDSLNFRWKYWSGSWGVLKSHPWIGTGWSNFGLHYLQFRLPEASEEIKDPHNFIVRFFCELGIVGGMIALLMLARGAWEITFPAAPPAPSSKPKAPARLGESLRPIIVIAMLAMAINIVASIEFHQDKSWVFLELMKRLLWLGLLVVAFAVAALRSSKDPVIDDRPAPWVIHGILVAIAIFLLHNTVDFSMFENGPMMLLALLCGAITGVRHPTSHGSRGRSPVAAYICAASAVGWCAIAIVVGVPVFEAEAKARDADEHVRQGNLRLAAEKPISPCGPPRFTRTCPMEKRRLRR